MELQDNPEQGDNSLDWEPILSGRLLMRHTAYSAHHPLTKVGPWSTVTTTKIEIIAADIRHLHLIEYVLAALAVADLPGKKWTVHHDGGSVRMVFTRPSDDLRIPKVEKVKSALTNLVLPTMELSHDT